MLSIYKYIWPCLEYCLHVWGCTSSIYLLDRVESKTFHLINAHYLTSQLPSLMLRSDVAYLSLLLDYCVAGPKNWGRNTKLSSSSNIFFVEVGHPHIGWYSSCFFPYTCNMWNYLPSSVFPFFYNLSSFKCRVYKHLGGIDWIFFYRFLII